MSFPKIATLMTALLAMTVVSCDDKDDPTPEPTPDVEEVDTHEDNNDNGDENNNNEEDKEEEKSDEEVVVKVDYAPAAVAAKAAIFDKATAAYSVAQSDYFTAMFSEEYPESFTVERADTNVLKVSFESATWGTFAIDSAAVLLTADSAYQLSGEGKVLMSAHGSQATEYVATISATFGADGYEVLFSVPSVMGGTTLQLFVGEAVAIKAKRIVESAIQQQTAVYSLTTCSYFSNQYAAESLTDFVSLSVVAADTLQAVVKSLSWGTTTVRCAVSIDNGSCTLSGNGTTELTSPDGTSVTYASELSLVASTSDAEIKVSVPSVMGGTTTQFYFGNVVSQDAVAAWNAFSATLSEVSTLATCSDYADKYLVDTADGLLTITAIDNDNVEVVLTSENYGVSTFTLPVTLSDGTYSVNGKGTTLWAPGSTTKKYVSEISLSYTAFSATLSITIPSYKKGLTVNFVFGKVATNLKIAKSYSGTTSTSLMGMSSSSSCSIVVSAQDDENLVSVTLPSFTYMSTIPSCTVPDVEVTENTDGTYTLHSDGYSTTLTVSGEEKDYNVDSLDGTITAEGKLTLTYVLQYGSMPYPMTFTFK